MIDITTQEKCFQELALDESGRSSDGFEEIAETGQGISAKQFVDGYHTGQYLWMVRVPKAIGMLAAHKYRDFRLQLFLLVWVSIFLVLLGGFICVFNILPALLAIALFSFAVSMSGLLFWFSTGDILMRFAMEDEPFCQRAIACKAISFSEDTEISLPQPEDVKSGDLAILPSPNRAEFSRAVG